jgi:hypothetical protein
MGQIFDMLRSKNNSIFRFFTKRKYFSNMATTLKVGDNIFIPPDHYGKTWAIQNHPDDRKTYRYKGVIIEINGSMAPRSRNVTFVHEGEDDQYTCTMTQALSFKKNYAKSLILKRKRSLSRSESFRNSTVASSSSSQSSSSSSAILLEEKVERAVQVANGVEDDDLPELKEGGDFWDDWGDSGSESDTDFGSSSDTEELDSDEENPENEGKSESKDEISDPETLWGVPDAIPDIMRPVFQGMLVRICFVFCEL